jgi:serpin B
MKKLFVAVTASVAVVAALFSTSCNNPSNPDATVDPVGPVGPVTPADPIELTTRGAEKIAADNEFAFRFFRETLATSPDKVENAFVSPLSLTMALGMLYNGTSPEAGAEIAEALGVGDFTPDEINAHYQTLMRALLAVDPLTALAIANSIWSNKNYSVKPTFYEVNQTYYDAEALSRDFSLTSTLDEINKWCADNTNSRIPKILDVIPPNAIMYLLNAVYFKGQWKFQFDKEKTYDANFSLADGSLKNVKMMNQDNVTVPSYEDGMLQCIDLPYGNGAFSMMVILPAWNKTLDELIATLDGDTYGKIVAGLSDRTWPVSMPRWKQECEFRLVDAMQNLGIERIFQSGNLSGIADDSRLAVSGINQNTFVEVNEEGTEAAAVTSVGFVTTSVPPSFRADRPFLYLIRECSTGAILFIGRVDNPKI